MRVRHTLTCPHFFTTVHFLNLVTSDIASSYSFTSTFPSCVIPSTLMYISSHVELLKNSTLALPSASVVMSGCHQMVRG